MGRMGPMGQMLGYYWSHMSHRSYRLFLLSTFCFLLCSAAWAGSVREPAVAGAFYPADPSQLQKMIETYLDQVPKVEVSEAPRILFVPHAGYIYSGSIAAHSYKLLQGQEYEAVVILAFSHHTLYPGVSIFEGESYKTPLGNVAIHKEIVDELKKDTWFSYHEQAHQKEHSLEVQLPFVQSVLPEVKIVPLVMGDFSRESAEKLASTLAKKLKDRNVLYLVSTDFSHYKKYEEANQIDKQSLEVIQTLSPEKVWQSMRSGLLEACGRGPILTAVFLANKLGLTEVQVLKYANSGDTAGDKSRVVGYGALLMREKKGGDTMKEEKVTDESTYSLEEKKELLKLARHTLQTYYETGKMEEVHLDNPRYQSDNGVFVTLKKKGLLRGCIGCFQSDKPLFKTIQDFSLNSALRDPRFPEVTKEELDTLDIEISVLSPMRKIDNVDEIVLGKHGIWIKKGYKSGTFLPQVATDAGWTLEEFLGHCAQDKAGIGWDGWRDAEIFVYTTEVFSEEELGIHHG